VYGFCRTWSTHPDYDALQTALSGVSDAATGVNAFVKAQDGAAKVTLSLPCSLHIVSHLFHLDSMVGEKCQRCWRFGDCHKNVSFRRSCRCSRSRTTVTTLKLFATDKCSSRLSGLEQLRNVVFFCSMIYCW
jgi:hypothetical protein